MCGIAGLVNWSGEPIDRYRLAQMIASLRHRGPDDAGTFVDGATGLGHARLSILDLAGGRQPMSNEDGSIWITFNGEIFNYVELRATLIERGHRFATRSDTEVIIHAYEEKGERCVDDFNGQWAFAIWDAKRRSLFLSRDRMGIVPLFYTSVPGSLLFASEIKSLFCDPRVTRELDLVGLDQTFTVWSPLAPRTAFRDVFELPAGHSMTVTARASRIARYWSPEFRTDDRPLSEQEYAEHLAALLRDATRLRLRSDVPVGAYVSGGLDSAVVTSLIPQNTSASLRTFAVTFDDPEFDERRFQRDVVDFVETDHSSLQCTPSEIGRAFPDVVWHAEKPLLRTAPAPMFLLAGLVRDAGYKVVLTGEGADEVLGGYDIFKEAKIRRFWAARPDSPRRPQLLRRLYPYLPQLQSQSTEYLKAFFHVADDSIASPFFSHLPRWRMTAGLRRFFSSDVRATLGRDAAYERLRDSLPSDYGSWDSFSQSQYLETTTLLPGYILSSQADRMMLAHGVEGRFPFLDHRLVEFAGRLPSTLKMKGLNEKYLLKRAFASAVPESVRLRKKQPYRAPDADSFFSARAAAASRSYVDDLLSIGSLKGGVFEPEGVERLVRKARAGAPLSTRDNMAVVAILSTELLRAKFIDRFQPPDATAGPIVSAAVGN